MINALFILIAMTLWGLLHSLLASRRLKQVLEPVLGRGYRLFYNLAAGLTFLPVLVLVPWLPDSRLYIVPAPWRWGLVLLQVIALLAAGMTLLQTDAWRFLGLRQLLQTEKLAPNTLSLGGSYKWVRHPLYFFSLVFLWLSPVMSLNQLTFYLGISFYFYIGAIFEERKLVSQFGEAYQHYQEQVPMLIPWPFLGRWPKRD